MPELPDLTVYQEALEARLTGHQLTGIRLGSPFILRSVSPGIEDICGLCVVSTRRLGKRVVICLAQEYFIVVHLMIAGRFRWYEAGRKLPATLGVIAFEFDCGTLVLTEAGQKKRASVHLIHGESALAELDPGGLEVLHSSRASFRERLTRQNHTIKRALTDPHILAGIGNAYSDEILHRARLSPLNQIKTFTDNDFDRLYAACRLVLNEWTDRLRTECGGGFPSKVTAFHAEMAVHGKYREPCPDCGKPVQRIRYATNECNYCAECQNQGNLLADRALSRLMHKDWPKRLEDLE